MPLARWPAPVRPTPVSTRIGELRARRRLGHWPSSQRGAPRARIPPRPRAPPVASPRRRRRWRRNPIPSRKGALANSARPNGPGGTGPRFGIRVVGPAARNALRPSIRPALPACPRTVRGTSSRWAPVRGTRARPAGPASPRAPTKRSSGGHTPDPCATRPPDRPRPKAWHGPVVQRHQWLLDARKIDAPAAARPTVRTP